MATWAPGRQAVSRGSGCPLMSDLRNGNLPFVDGIAWGRRPKAPTPQGDIAAEFGEVTIRGTPYERDWVLITSSLLLSFVASLTDGMLTYWDFDPAATAEPGMGLNSQNVLNITFGFLFKLECL